MATNIKQPENTDNALRQGYRAMHRTVIAIAVVLTMTAAPGFTVPATAAEYTVLMKFDSTSGKVYFEPDYLKIKSGDTVKWLQGDNVNEHNVVTYPNRIPKGTNFFESPMLKKTGQSWSRKFTKRGSYYYHCHPHEAMGMNGLIVVERESRADEFRTARPGEHVHAGHGDYHAVEHGKSHPHHGAGHSAQSPAHGGGGHAGHGGHHGSMVTGTSPTDGATLKSSPKNVVISFIHPMKLTVLNLTTLAGESIPIKIRPGKASSKNTVSVPELESEDYLVEWQAVGSDGHTMSGSFKFSVE